MNTTCHRFCHNGLQRAIELLKCATWGVCYWPWVLRGKYGGPISVEGTRHLTVLIPTYYPSRMNTLTPLIRSLLRCTFIGKIIVSNNNPAARIHDHIGITDRRLVLLDQPVRHGPGFMWELAGREDAGYFMLIDDDVLVSAEQVALLFRQLVGTPEIPHGLAGRCGSRYVQGRDTEVDNLYLLYAATRAHVERYLDFAARIATAGFLTVEDSELWGNDLILSWTGSGKPLIHDVGFLQQSLTCYHSEMAIHKQTEFETRRKVIEKALEAVSGSSRSTESGT